MNISEELNKIPFFSKLSAGDLKNLESYLSVHNLDKDMLIASQGDNCKSLYAIIKGRVKATISGASSKSEITLASGTVFGSMSLIANVSMFATLTSMDEVSLLTLDHKSFNEIYDKAPRLYESIMKELMYRIQYKAILGMNRFETRCIFITYDQQADTIKSVVKLLSKAISYYADQARFISEADDNEIVEEVKRWRDQGSAGHPLVAVLSKLKLAEISNLIRDNDSVLYLNNASAQDPLVKQSSARAKFSVVKLGKSINYGDDGEFCYELSDEKVEMIYDNIDHHGYQLGESRSIDRIIRRLLNREVGLALGAGAARGFAHIGVLLALEENNIPVDFLSGTSIGGAVALVYGLTGSATKTRFIIQSALGAKDKVQDLSLLPRRSLLAGKKIRASAEHIFRDMTFADLKIPVEVVSSDIGRAEKFVLNSGLLKEAVLATSAIPGIFPPMLKPGRVLVDGALVSKVPVDILRSRLCAVKISVNATTAKGLYTGSMNEEDFMSDSLEAKISDIEHSFELNRGLNLGSIINHSWDLLSWSEASEEADRADISIHPDTRAFSNFDFDDFDVLVDIGYQATLKKLPAIKVAVAKILEPNVYV